MKTALILVASCASMALAAPTLAKDVPAPAVEVPSSEVKFAQCVYDKNPTLAGSIKDAPSQEAFVAALKQGATLCETDVDGMSLGRFFTALNKLVPDYGESGGAE
ncbi:MAG: hypothetical protein P8J20_10915 [Novosphingobium sp.]|nr:hypothetical protein [Novosphingobium sp.]